MAAGTAHVADLARNVAGDRAQVRALVTPGVDPHDHEPRPSEVSTVANAALVLRSGGDVDAWLDEVAHSAGKGRPVALIDSVGPVGSDPHWWQDPVKARAAVEEIGERLAVADPAGAATYRDNADRYHARLVGLHDAIARCMEAIPASRRTLVTTHEAFGHFARRYEIEVVGAALPSLSTQAQPSTRDVTRLVERMRARDVRVVFAERGVNTGLVRAVAREAGARLGEQLWGDTLGPRGSGADTYLGATAANARAMARGFSAGAESCPKVRQAAQAGQRPRSTTS